MKDYVFLQQWMFDLFTPINKGMKFDYIKVMIFAYIYSYSRDGRSCWYGKQQTLAELVHSDESTICRKLKELVNDGFIDCEKIDCYGMFHHNNYRINHKYLQTTVVDCASTVVDCASTNNKSLYNSYTTTLQNGTLPILKGESLPPGDEEGNIYKPPTADEARQYALTKGLGKNELFEQIDWQYFVDYYDAQDWKDKQGKQLNWRQKVVGWVNNQKPKEQRTERKSKGSKGIDNSYKGGLYNSVSVKASDEDRADMSF